VVGWLAGQTVQERPADNGRSLLLGARGEKWCMNFKRYVAFLINLKFYESILARTSPNSYMQAVIGAVQARQSTHTWGSRRAEVPAQG
jgi:hypothetical protein